VDSRFGGDGKSIFVNKEQAEKPRYSNTLSQEAIHRAFRRPQRRSQMFYEYLDTTITLLSRKHTGRLGVEKCKSYTLVSSDTTDSCSESAGGIVSRYDGLSYGGSRLAKDHVGR
jgi:hypothetical protein